MRKQSKIITFLCLITIGLFFVGCAGPSLPKPGELTAPKPILSNSGTYMCPYTQDDVLAEWTDKAINAKMGATIGKHVGAYAGQKALEQVPFVGGFLGSKVGEAVGRKIAIEGAGGEQFIKQSSDVSFNNIDDLAVYMYVKYTNNEHYQSALEATMEIYPELKTRYFQALHSGKSGNRAAYRY